MPHIEKKTLQENSGCQYPFNPKTFFKIQDDPSERRSYTHFTNKKQQAEAIDVFILKIFSRICNNMKAMIKNPNAQLGRYKMFVTSGEAVTAASTVIITPLILQIVNRVIANNSFLSKYVGLSLILASIVIFIIAGYFSGYIRQIGLGMAVGVLINGLLTFPQIASLVGRISASATSRGSN